MVDRNSSRVVVLGGFWRLRQRFALSKGNSMNGALPLALLSPLLDRNTIGGPSLRPLILAGPLGFAHLLLYRKAYYRAFFLIRPLVPSVNHFVATIAGKPFSFHPPERPSLFFLSRVLFIIFFGTTPSAHFSRWPFRHCIGTLVLTIMSRFFRYTLFLHSLRHLAAVNSTVFPARPSGARALQLELF